LKISPNASRRSIFVRFLLLAFSGVGIVVRNRKTKVVSMQENVSDLFLKYGAHKTPDEGVCLLEAVAYVAGEPHSDHPQCVDMVLGAFGRAVNDWMKDDERQQLVPIIPMLIGTNADHTVSLRRSMMICDGVVRQILPMAFDAISLEGVAKTLRDLEPITDEKTAHAARSAARRAVESAARSAARRAAESADRSAAYAAQSAARSAAYAAESAARSAAYAAAYAAESAARSAAYAAYAAYAAANAAWSAAESAAQSAADANAASEKQLITLAEMMES
jgi:hypothetical protein